MKKFFFATILLFLGLGHVWGAITPKSISSSSGEVYLVTPANCYSWYNSGNGWVTNGSGGAVTSDSYYNSKTSTKNTSYINPETEATGTNTSVTGITLKTADNRSARFYFTGATAVYAFTASTGNDRSSTLTVYKVSDDTSVGADSEAAGTGTYHKLTVTGLSASESYYAKVTATNDMCLYAMKFFAPTLSTRTFKSGEKIYFKDQESNFDFSALWKVSSGNVYAYFWNDTENAWSDYGNLIEGSWNAANAIYEITVPGSGKEFTKVLFTRGNAVTWDDTWDKTEDQTPVVGKNLFYVYKTKYADHVYKGAWGNFTPADKTVYFDNRNVSTWTTAYVRIGHGSNNAAWGAMTKVAGTKYLYSQTTSKYASHTDFAIADKAGWTGSNPIDQPYNSDGIKPNDSYKMTKQTNYQQYAIDSNTYICPKATSVSYNDCQYYQVTNANSTTSSRIDEKTVGMRLPQYAVEASGTNCTVSLAKFTSDPDAVSPTTSNISSGDKVDPTQYVKATVTPNTGYTFSSVNLTSSAYEQHTAAAAGTPGVYAILANCTITATCTANQYSVTHTLSNVTKSSGATGSNAATYGTDYTAMFAASSGYELPESITVTIGGSTKTAGTEYTWNSSTGVVTVDGDYILGAVVITITGEEDCGIMLTQFGTQYKTSSPRRLYAYTSNSFDEKFIIEADDSNTKGVTNSETDSLYLLVKNGKCAKIHASSSLKDSTFDDVTKIKFDYRIAAKKTKTLTLDVYVGSVKVGSVSQDVTDQTWYTKTIDLSASPKDGRVTIINTAGSSDQSIHLNNINICGTLPILCTEITPTWSTDYTSTTLNVGSTSSTPVVGKDGSSGTLSFSSSDNAIATVNSSGVVTAVKSGSVTITATVAEDAVNNKCEGTVTKTFTIKAGVTYDKNGADSGDAPTDATYYAANADITILGNTGSMVKAGKIFNGWNTKSDGTGNHYEVGATMKMETKKSGVKLYAEWVGYATSWEWWNSGQSNESTAFTYLTDKNYVLSFASSNNKNIASWDMSGGEVYRGVKIKTKDHSMSFWVEEGKLVSITFGYMSTKPTFTVGGVNKTGDLSTSTTDSATVTYTTSADTKFYIENETATGTAFTIKSVKIENACTSITPTLTYDNTAIWVGESVATPTLNKDGSTGSVTYASSNTDAATVNESTGVVTAVAHGTTTITATIDADGTHCANTASCNITVKEASCGYNEIASAVLTSKTAATLNNATLLANGLGDISSGSCKLNGKGAYFGLQLASGSFQVGDSIEFKIKGGDDAEAYFFATTDTTGLTTSDAIYCKSSISKGTDYVVRFIVTSGSMLTKLNATKKITIVRRTKSGVLQQNHSVYYVKVKRYTCPEGLMEFDATANSNWSTAGNWVGATGRGAGLPTINDRVHVMKPVTVDVTTAKAERVYLFQNSTNTGSLVLDAGKELVVARTVRKTTDGSSYTATGENDIVFNSTSALGLAALAIGSHATANGLNNATVNFSTLSNGSTETESAAKASDAQYVGTPFSNEPAMLYQFYNSWMYKFVNTGTPGWTRVDGADGLEAFKGYCIFSADGTGHSYWMQGTLVASEDQSINLVYNGGTASDAKNENMLANSWMAPIKIAAFEASDFTSANATIYIYNTGSPDDYKDNSGATTTGTSAGQYQVYTPGTAGSAIIPSMQAFSVYTSGSSPKITLDYSKLVYDPAAAGSVAPGPNKAPSHTSIETDKPEKMRLYIGAESGYGDMLYMLEREDFAEGFENGWDGRKMFGEDVAPQLYALTPDGNMAINCIPTFEGQVLGFRKGTEDSFYTFTFEYDGENIWYLNDLREQTSTLINSESTYMFMASDEDMAARFIISATPIHHVATGIDLSAGRGQQSAVRKIVINDHVFIIRNGQLYDVTGKTVK